MVGLSRDSEASRPSAPIFGVVTDESHSTASRDRKTTFVFSQNVDSSTLLLGSLPVRTTHCLRVGSGYGPQLQGLDGGLRGALSVFDRYLYDSSDSVVRLGSNKLFAGGIVSALTTNGDLMDVMVGLAGANVSYVTVIVFKGPQSTIRGRERAIDHFAGLLSSVS